MEFASEQTKSDTWTRDFSGHLLRPWSIYSLNEPEAGAPGRRSIYSLNDTESGASERRSRWWTSSSETPEVGAHERTSRTSSDTLVEYVKPRKQASAWSRPLLSRSPSRPEPSSTGSGWWQNQMLFDRSLRSMATLTSLYAVIMLLICVAKLRPLANRDNPSSTSIGLSHKKTCANLKQTEIAIQLLINIAATTILGMSNTYQQLATSLHINEIRWSLSKFGDSRVGTNSPTTINRKQHGKTKAWLSWLLLIFTSLPIHFFANSVIGPSVYLTTPKVGRFLPNGNNNTGPTFPSDSKFSYYGTNPDQESFNLATTDLTYYDVNACWILFRTGSFDGWQRITAATQEPLEGFSYELVNVSFPTKCDEFANKTTFAEMETEIDWPAIQSEGQENYPTLGNCSARTDVSCQYSEENDLTCRLTIRMSAALILTVCLVVKAIYMIIINVKGRERRKSQCLTFGDVIVACIMDRSLPIRNECMVNAGEAYRHSTLHTCHKHCKSKEPSETGDELGHCQKCKTFNDVDKAADLPHPCIATKYKKSLLSNLGTAALTQMVLLSLASTAMIAGSATLAVFIGSSAAEFKRSCSSPLSAGGYSAEDFDCAAGVSHYLRTEYGGFGGFDSTATIGVLPADQANSEMLAFAISNGLQLLYSLLYLLLVYNFTLISMEYDWGNLERRRSKLRSTLVRGAAFRQSYLLQLPKRVIYPMMTFSALMHWLLGQAISTRELIWAFEAPSGNHNVQSWESSQYQIVYGAYSIWVATIFMFTMTATCWWAFTYIRQGFIPQMYGSIRVCCAAATQLDNHGEKGIMWGDLGVGDKFRHAGFSNDEVGPIRHAELYAGHPAAKSESPSDEAKKKID